MVSTYYETAIPYSWQQMAELLGVELVCGNFFHNGHNVGNGINPFRFTLLEQDEVRGVHTLALEFASVAQPYSNAL